MLLSDPAMPSNDPSIRGSFQLSSTKRMIEDWSVSVSKCANRPFGANASVGGRERLGFLHRQGGGPHRQGTIAGLGAEDLEAARLVGVALAEQRPAPVGVV